MENDIQIAIRFGNAMGIGTLLAELNQPDEMDEAHKEMDLEDRYDVEEMNLKYE